MDKIICKECGCVCEGARIKFCSDSCGKKSNNRIKKNRKKDKLNNDPIKKETYMKDRREYFKTYMNNRYQSNADIRKEKRKEVRNTPEANQKRADKAKARKHKEPLYRMKCNIRSLISITMKNQGFKKSARAHQILGCTYEEFKTYIEVRFLEGMTWENYSMWEYDHIIPISSALSEEDCIRLNHYTNFQPLWKKDNMKKSNTIII